MRPTPQMRGCYLFWKWGLCRWTQVKMRSYWISRSPYPVADVLTRRGNFDVETDTGECHVVMGAEVGVRLPDARECRGLLAAAGSWDGGMEQLLPQSPHGASPQRGPTTGYQAPSFQDCERINCSCYKPPVRGNSTRQAWDADNCPGSLLAWYTFPALCPQQQ